MWRNEAGMMARHLPESPNGANTHAPELATSLLAAL